MMDNVKLDIFSSGAANLERALRIAFAHHGEKTTANQYWTGRFALQRNYYASDATGSQVPNLMKNNTPVEGLCVRHTDQIVRNAKGHLTLVLCTGPIGYGPDLRPDDMKELPLPYCLTADNVTPFVQEWLKHTGDPGPGPDIDGEAEASAFRIYTDHWGKVEGAPGSAIVAIQCHWAMYGK